MNVNDTLTWTWQGNALSAWLVSLGLLTGVIAVLLVARWLVVKRWSVIAARTDNWVDDLVVDIIQRTKSWFVVLVAVVIAVQMLSLTPGARTALRSALVIGALVQVAIWGNGIISFWVHQFRSGRRGDTSGLATISALAFGGRLVLASLIVLTALRNFGVDITALVAGLGIGGIAIALAVQNILGDLFGALSIVLDKPFVIGDAIAVDQIEGTVEHVGLKTTRIRSSSGEQVIVSNADLLRSRIRNFKRLSERRVAPVILVSLDTAPAIAARIPDMLRQIVERQAPVRFDRAHLRRISDRALEYEVVYFVKSPDYLVHMDVQQAVALGVLDAFRGEGIALARAWEPVASDGGGQAGVPR
jgi:small-conductance mechanosensitive channel